MRKLGAGGRTVVATESNRRISCDGRDHASGNLANVGDMSILGNIQVAGGIQRYGLRLLDAGAGSWAIISARTVHPISRHCSDHPVRDFADPPIAQVRYEKV